MRETPVSTMDDVRRVLKVAREHVRLVELLRKVAPLLAEARPCSHLLAPS